MAAPRIIEMSRGGLSSVGPSIYAIHAALPAQLYIRYVL